MLEEGEVALLGYEGIDAVNALAHDIGQTSVALLRTEDTPAGQDETVIAYADALPLIWVAPEFSARVETWAHDRGAMTLLAAAGGALDDEKRRTIDRFVAILGRQSE
jgi:hypothetical protein